MSDDKLLTTTREICPHCLGSCNPLPEGSGYCEKCQGTGWAQPPAPVKESPLRDLARKIRAVAREHIASSQVSDFMNHIDDHLNCLAFAEETNQRNNNKEPH